MKKNKSLIITLILFTLVCLFFTYRSYEVRRDGVYTIATIYNLGGARSGIGFDFKYTFKGIEHKHHANSSDLKMSDEGARFFIHVLPDDPDRCFFTDYRVPDFITETPYAGWASIRDEWKIIK